MKETFAERLVGSKNFRYQIVAFEEIKDKADGSGFYYIKGADVTVSAKNEEEALDQAKLLVARSNYAVFNVVEN